MNRDDGFVALCERLRFADDEPSDDRHLADTRHQLADYTAHIRAEALRITPTITPDLHRTLCTVASRLGLPEAPETYVTADPKPNAFAPTFGVRDRPVMIFTSGLVELLSPAELQFVVGHELGHLGLHNKTLNLGETYSSEFEALKARSLSRCAEVSADRVGLAAIGSLLTAGNVMIKLASGLSSRHVQLDVKAFLDQLQRHPEETNREWELYQLHPSLPLRLWALIQFSQTTVYSEQVGTGSNGIDLEEVDRRISARLADLGYGRLSQMEQRRFDIAATWVGTALVFDDEIIEEREEVQLRKLIGDDLAEKALKFAKSQGIDAVLEKLEESLQELSECGRKARRKILETHRAFAENLNMEPTTCRAGRTIYRLVGSD